MVKIGIITKDGKPAFNEFLKLKSSGFMDLNIDFLYEKDDNYTIVMAHNYLQNGDVMADPEMEISVTPGMKMAEALTYKMDGLGIERHVYHFDSKGNKMVNKRYHNEQNRFLNTWLGNIKRQGFKNLA